MSTDISKWKYKTQHECPPSCDQRFTRKKKSYVGWSQERPDAGAGRGPLCTGMAGGKDCKVGEMTYRFLS